MCLVPRFMNKLNVFRAFVGLCAEGVGTKSLSPVCLVPIWIRAFLLLFCTN